MRFRWAWNVCRWCVRQGCRLSLWTIWLLLLVALAGQIHLLSSRRVPMPEPLRRNVERRLATLGLDLKFGRAKMDFTGRFLLEDVRLGFANAPAPLATARTVYLHIDPWDLLLKKFTLREVQVGGLDLHLPGAHATSGKDERPAGNIDFALRPQGNGIALSHFTGYLGRLPVRASGRLALPSATPPATAPKVTLERAIAAYLDYANRTSAIEGKLAAFESPRLHLRLNATHITVDFDAHSVDLGTAVNLRGGKLGGVQVKTGIPLGSSSPSLVNLIGTVRSAELPREITARDLTLRLEGVPDGPNGFDARSVELQLSSLRWREVEAGPFAVSGAQSTDGFVTADASFTLAGAPWRIQASALPRTGEGRARLDGFVDDATLAFAGAQIKRDLASLLDPEGPAPFNASVTFGADWKLIEASGRLHSGPVRVGTVQLDETGTEFTYDGARVLCDHLVLRQGESLAHGSYAMDAATTDFRFLLTGGLRPMGIQGWFHEWWPNFWSTFDFSHGLPDADVDVRGRWGDLTATQVFVQAEGAGTGLKGVEFDRVRTRLFLRPHWFDILHFDVRRDEHDAQGWLARSLDLENETWRHMEFSVDSTLPLETISSLFKAESAELLAPYRFTKPPRLRLSGRVDSEASPLGKHERIDISLTSTGAMTYHEFPLSDLKFEAQLRDDRIELPSIAVTFAEGQAHGKASLRGVADAQRLAFDISLADANLGAVSQAVALLQPKAAPPAGKSSESARQRQDRLEQGRLVFTLAAEGLFKDFYSFKGSGRAAITGTELAQLNLFGPLSEALRGTYFSFGSFSLTTVDAPFTLREEKVTFDDLRITGPNALLQAKGDYKLRDGRLDFSAKIHPFDESSSMVGNAMGFVLTPLSSVFEVKLQGTLSKPSWIFAYGPSRLFNTITGGEKTPVSPVIPPKTDPQP
jgi:hypothetical protein